MIYKFTDFCALIALSVAINLPETREQITITDAKMFYELVGTSEKTWMVNFYKRTCPHCKKIDPIWLEFIAQQADRKDIEFAKFDCIDNSIFCEQFPLHHCPDVLVFKGNTDPVKSQSTIVECDYVKDWTLEDLNTCLPA